MKTNELITEEEEKRFFDLGYIVEVEKITKTRGRLLNIFTGKCSEIDESKNELYHYVSNLLYRQLINLLYRQLINLLFIQLIIYIFL